MSKNIKTLVYCSACIALFTISSMIPVFSLPTGGSVTLFSMLFATLPGFFFGPVAGISSGVACGVLNFILKPYMLTPVQVILDYILAFGAFGLSGFFSNKENGLTRGYILACIARWFFSFLSGWVFFGEYAWTGWNPVLYSAVYNIIYIGAEAVITLAVLHVPALLDAFMRVKSSATAAN
ncbi:proton-coupled thiamine transporter YuaJ [Oribacterium sp. C9]|uniref:energy-coupled thiamine transporter ThiT n=1 Tax=Oribacterium sp. C9 TaxID=1943579 RepID=UPI00098F34F8|nr:energy-coupled thiamine transporter ThiT [Oribacterium sp. C9]OON85578.1 proton-coupled thiamine transporter YuaJ [Oribacterium sp. C9]